MIEDKRVSELKFNLDEKIDEAIRFRRNDQLNQFSNIYFNKLKKDLIILSSAFFIKSAKSSQGNFGIPRI